MKYIFLIGAPGSKCNLVCKSIYWSLDIDHSDYSPERTYYNSLISSVEPIELGSWFGPGMEFGNWFEKINDYSKEQCEAEFDRPFKPNSQGIRIIKSHVLAHHLYFIAATWPDSVIVSCYRNHDACLGWWIRSGHFGISYPKYDHYQNNFETIAKAIEKQNKDILRFNASLKSETVSDNNQLCDKLGIARAANKVNYGAYDTLIYFSKFQ